MTRSSLSPFRSIPPVRFRALPGPFGAKDRRRERRRCRHLLLPEQLEDRLLPTVVFDPVFPKESLVSSTAPSGSFTVLNSPTIYVIFWGSTWSSSTESTDATDAQNLVKSTFFNELHEYGNTGTPQWGNSWADPSDPPSGYTAGNQSAADVSALQGEIAKAIGKNPPWAPSSTALLQSPIYVVVANDNSGGYNTQGTYGSGQINMCSVNGGNGNANNFTSVLSHELAEDITDPTGNNQGVTLTFSTATSFPGFINETTKPPGVNNTPGLAGNIGYLDNSGTVQIGDGEQEPGAQTHYGYQLNGVEVQSLWSNATQDLNGNSGAFVVNDGGSETAYLDPIWTNQVIPNPSTGNLTNPAITGPVFTGTYNLTVAGNVITVDAGDSQTTVLVDYQWFTFTNYDPIKGITIKPVGAGASITIDSLAADQTVTVDAKQSSNSDTIDVSPGGDQSAILGTINVRNEGAASATINIDDSSDKAAARRTVTFSAIPYFMVDQITFSGLGTISYDYGTEFKPQITITGSSFGNTYDVENADVQSLTIHSNGSDSVTLGNSNDGVQAITGDVILTNVEASTNLTVDDSNDPTTTPDVGLGVDMTDVGAPGSPPLTYGTVDGLLPNGFSVFYQDSSLASLTVRTDQVNGNTVNIGATFAPTYVITGGKSPLPFTTATVNVGPGGALPLINGDVYIESPNGTNTVNVNDSLDSVVGRQVTLSDYTPPSPAPAPFDSTDTFGRISGLTTSGATINYEYLDTSSVTIQTGPADIVNVLSTGFTTTNLVGAREPNLGTDPTIVNVGNAGSLAGIRGTLNIENPPFSNDVTLDDSADTSAPTFTVSTLGVNPEDSETNADQWGQISGLLTGASINYEYLDTPGLTLKTGPGATVDVLATEHRLDLLGNGQTTVNLGNQGNVQGLSGSLFIDNQVPEQTTLYVDDSADTTSLQDVQLDVYQDPTTFLPYDEISNLALGATIYAQDFGVASVSITGGTPSSGGNIYNINNTTFNASVTLTAGYGGDTVNILGNSGPVIVDPNGETETVNVGNAGLVQDVTGGITIKPGLVSLTVDDSADPNPRTVSITSQGLDNGLAPFALRSPWLTYSTLHSLLVKGGTPPPVNGATATGNTFNVLSTPYTSFGATTVETGGARNAVNVQSSTTVFRPQLNIQGNGGIDTVTLGSLAPNLGGNMANIPSVDVTNPGGSTTLILDDSGDTAPRTPTVTGSSVTNLGSDPRVGFFGTLVDTQTIQYAAGQVTSLVVYAGSGGNTFAVQGTGAGTATILSGGSGGDTANVYGNTGTLAAQNFANVNIGQNSLVSSVSGGIVATNDASVSVDDSNDSNAQTITITATTVSGFPGYSTWVTYSGLRSLTIRAGTPAVNGVPTGAGNTFYVEGTAPMPAGTPSAPGGTILDGGQGPDTFDVGSDPVNLPLSALDLIQGAITINGKGNSTLNINDSGTTISENYSVSPTSIQRSIIVAGFGYDYNTAPINYCQVGKVAVYVGSAQTGVNQGAVINTLDVFGTQPGTTTDLYGNNSGGQTQFAIAPYESAPPQGSGGGTYNANNQLLGAVHYHASSRGFDTVTYYDYLDQAARSYAMTAGQIVAAGFAPLTYDGRVYGAALFTAEAGGSTVNLSSTGPGGLLTHVLANTGDVVTVGSQAPALGGSLSQMGEMILQTIGSAQSATFILDDSGDPNAETANYYNDGYAPGFSGLSPSRIYFFTVGSGSNVQVRGGTNPANSLTATFPGDFNQNWTVSGFSTSSGFTIPGNFTGSLLAPTLGTATQPIQQIQIGGSMTSTAKIKVNYLSTLSVGSDLAGTVYGYGPSKNQKLPTIGAVTIGGNFSGTITAPVIGKINQRSASSSLFSGHVFETTPGMDLQSVVLGTVTSTAVIQAGAIASATVAGDMAGQIDVSGPLGTLSVGCNLTGTVSATTIDSISVGQNLTGNVSASQSIGSVSAAGTISGSVSAPTIQQATVDGTASGNDTFILTPSSMVLNGTTIISGTFGSLAVQGGNGNDLFQIEGGVVPATITAGTGNDTFEFFTGATITGALDGGSGTNTLDYSQYVGNILVDLLAGSATAVGGGIANIQQVKGSQGNDLLVGNANPSTLVGGTGRNVLIGGAGLAALDASRGSGDNILIGGTTNWDLNLAALEAIMAEWDRSDLGFSDRRSDLLNGTNGQGKAPLNIVNGQLVLLTPATNPQSSNGTVHANAYADTLIGSGAIDPATGKRVHNWFLYARDDAIENYASSSDKKDHVS